MGDQIPTTLAAVEAALQELFSLPHNVGIRLRRLTLPTEPITHLLALFVHGLSDEHLVRTMVIEPVEQAAAQEGAPQLLPDDMSALLPAPRLSRVCALSVAVTAVLDGATALFFDGLGEAVLVGTEGRTAPASMLPAGVTIREEFGAGMAENVVLLRKRLRDPRLVAEPLRPLHPNRAGISDSSAWLKAEMAPHFAMVYLKGRAHPELLDRVRTWAEQELNEERMQQGRSTGFLAALGFLPEVITSRCADQVSPLLTAGYVVVLVEQVPYACVAPVTASAMLYAPGDETLVRPVAGAIRLGRVLLLGMIVLSPALVVALLSYHQEMVPTPLLLSLAASRVSLPLPIVATVLVLELYQELVRLVANRLPSFLPVGSSVVGAKILILIMITAGIIGPVPAIVSVLVQYAAFGLPSYDALYMARLWRFWLIFGAAFFGLAGMATVSFVLAAYMSQTESFGVSFADAGGLCLSWPGKSTGRGKGGNLCAPSAPR